MKRPDIVVVGASAGGVEALLTLVAGLPATLPASIFVVVHIGQEDGHLAQILNRNGNMRVVRAMNASPIRPSNIYVAPPNYHLTLENNRMWLTIGPKINRSRPAIDPLFESASAAFDGRVIGIVLTGYLDDGTIGLAAIKDRGGITIVQDPREAFAPYMPRNALRHVKVDYCLPLAQIAPLLVDLVQSRNSGNKNRN